MDVIRLKLVLSLLFSNWLLWVCFAECSTRCSFTNPCKFVSLLLKKILNTCILVVCACDCSSSSVWQFLIYDVMNFKTVPFFHVNNFAEL